MNISYLFRKNIINNFIYFQTWFWKPRKTLKNVFCVNLEILNRERRREGRRGEGRTKKRKLKLSWRLQTFPPSVWGHFVTFVPSQIFYPFYSNLDVNVKVSRTMACSEFLHRRSEEKAGKVWYFIQKSNVQIASDRSCRYDFSKIPETSWKKNKHFSLIPWFTWKKRKLLGNLPVNTWRFMGNYLVIYWSLLSIWLVITWYLIGNYLSFY